MVEHVGGLKSLTEGHRLYLQLYMKEEQRASDRPVVVCCGFRFSQCFNLKG